MCSALVSITACYLLGIDAISLCKSYSSGFFFNSFLFVGPRSAAFSLSAHKFLIGLVFLAIILLQFYSNKSDSSRDTICILTLRDFEGQWCQISKHFFQFVLKKWIVVKFVEDLMQQKTIVSLHAWDAHVISKILLSCRFYLLCRKWLGWVWL